MPGNPDSMNDVHLFSQVKEGNQVAYEQLFKQYYADLCGYAEYVLKDISQSEDLVQEVFVQLWQKKDQVQINESLKSYLYRSVKNRCLNEFRHNKVKDQHVEYAKASSRDHYDAVDHVVEGDDLKNQLTKSLEKLPPKCKKVFLMNRYEEKKYSEIAEELDISVKAVEAHMSKALKILRVELKDFLSLILIMLWNSH